MEFKMSKAQIISATISTTSTNVTTPAVHIPIATSSTVTPPNTPNSSIASPKSFLKDLKTTLKNEETKVKATLKAEVKHLEDELKTEAAHKVDELKAATKQVEVMLENQNIPAEFLTKVLNQPVGPNGMSVEAGLGKLAFELAMNPQGTLPNVTAALIGEAAEIAEETVTTCWSFLKS
jgi:hypothetical protein